MNLQDYQEDINQREYITQIKESIQEQLELIATLAQINQLAFYKYNYEYNEFIYEYTIDSKGNFINETQKDTNKKYELLIKYNDITFGKITTYDKPIFSFALRKLFRKLKKNFNKLHEHEKGLYGNAASFNIYIIHDTILEEFAKNLSSGLKGLFNVDVYRDTSLQKNLQDIQTKDMKHILIYLVNSEEIINRDKTFIQKLNELIIVIGPNDHSLSMLSGKLGIQNYIPINEFKAEDVKDIILQTRKNLINKSKFDNKIIAFTGISGGIGTTTIAMNTANELSQNLPDKNILYIDLATTKAVSNLFLEKNPLPEKTILDLVNTAEFNLTNNLENGLIKVRENFYAITGIQKHIDKELLEQNTFIEKLLDYIMQSCEHFNFIIIDIGISDASNLKTTIYDLVNEIWMVTEMSLPHIAKLKTFYNLMKRASLRDKVSFIVNRYDSENAISVADVTSILNMSKDDKIYFDFRIPNDYKTLGRCWNYCELASQSDKDSVFVKSLEDILEQKEFFKKSETPKKSLFSFLSKDK